MVEGKTARQLQKDDTRARVFATAAGLFAERGYHGTTVDEIARRAGVAKGTFFIHFASKDAVVAELVRLQTRAAHRARARAVETGANAVGALRATVLMLGEQAGASRELSRAVLAATLESPTAGGAADALFDEVFQQMAADARTAVEAKLLAGDPDVIASALMSSYLGAALHFTSSPRPRAIATLLCQVVDANLAGFTPAHSFKEKADAQKTGARAKARAARARRRR